MSDGEVEVKRHRGVAIGGLGVTYQIIIGDGRTIAYEAAIDATAAREDLDDLLDLMGGAAERRQAMFELPLVQQSLLANRKQLEAQRTGRAQIVAASQARQSHANANRRVAREMPATADEAAIAQFDERIGNIETQIRLGEARVPYLQAVIARETPPAMFPQDLAPGDMSEAAD